MHTVSITIKTVNAAFEPDPWPEVARILAVLASDIRDQGNRIQPLRHDINGNIVGRVETRGGAK